jgi:hypothetical protein
VNNNTVSGFHIAKRKENILKLSSSKLYNWHIPKHLRENPIHKGDIVLVQTSYGRAPVLVMDVFREEFEETHRSYKRVLTIIERAPKKEPVS